MFYLFDVLGLVATFGFVAVFLSNRKLRARVERLEALMPIASMQPVSPAWPVAPEESNASAQPASRAQPDAPLAPSEADAWEDTQEGWPETAQVTGTSAIGPPPQMVLVETVTAWLQRNWFYAVSALCLSLAGLFAAQYAADQGLLAPGVRIALAVAMGLALVGAGEVIRRRVGDAPDVSTAYLPSVFSGAGIVTLFGAVLSAQLLYAMMPPLVTLALLAAIAVASIGLGWFYGPLLAVVGLVGATAAPFLVGGDPGAPGLLNIYFGAVALAGLAINALQKWRWVTGLALFLPYAAAVFTVIVTGDTIAFIVHSVALAVVGGIAIGGSLHPRLPGPSSIPGLASSFITGSLRGSSSSQGTLAALWVLTVLGIVTSGATGHLEMMVSSIGLAGLFLFGSQWSRRGSGAIDLVLLSAAGLFMLSALRNGAWTAEEFEAQGMPAALASLPPLLVLVAAGFAASAIATLRSFSPKVVSPQEEPFEERLPVRDPAEGDMAQAPQSPVETLQAAAAQQRSGHLWAAAAASIGPGLLVIQEMLWAPADAIGPVAWAAIAMVFAIGGTVFAERVARLDPADRLKLSMGAVVAFSMIALAFFVLISEAALTVALSVLILSCMVLDLRFRLPALRWFVQAGAAVIVYRAVVDPGLAWGLDAATGEVMLGYAVPAVLVGAAWAMIERPHRPVEQAALEGTFAVLVGTGISIAVIWMGERAGYLNDFHHWSLGVMATVWLIAGYAALRTALQPQASDAKGHLAHQVALILRLTSAGAAGVVATVAMLAAIGPMNPLTNPGEDIWGVVVLNSLAPAYMVPGLLIAGMSWRLPGIGEPARRAGFTVGGFLAFLYACLSVAQAWRGNALTAVPMGDGELWSYTALLVAVGGGLLLAAIARGSMKLRHAANAMLILAIAKVFLVDAPDLEGLVRAASFLVLGLALAGLAWVNRRATMRR